MIEGPGSYYKSYFTKPWCPLMGNLLMVDCIPNSPKYQCWRIIFDARLLLMDWCDYVHVDYLIDSQALKDSFVYMGESNKHQWPCDDCKKSKQEPTGLHMPCNDESCEEFTMYIDWANQSNKSSLCPDIKFFQDPDNRIKLLSARAIFDNFAVIEEQALWWPDHPAFILKYGSHHGQTLASAWERVIEETKTWAKFWYKDKRRGIEYPLPCDECKKGVLRPDGSLRSCDQSDCDYTPPDYAVLSVLAISQAWYVLRDILLFGELEDNPEVLKDTKVAQDLLTTAKEEKNKPIIEALQKETESLQKEKEALQKDAGSHQYRTERSIQETKKRRETDHKLWREIAENRLKEDPNAKIFTIANLVIKELIKTQKIEHETKGIDPETGKKVIKSFTTGTIDKFLRRDEHIQSIIKEEFRTKTKKSKV